MARISKYINDETFSEKDKVVGSSYVGTVNGVDQFKTRNFSMSTLQERLGDKSFTFALKSADHNTFPEVENSWKIIHDLNKRPSVTIIDSAGNTINGDVIYTDENTLYVVTSFGFSGTAYLN